MLAPFDRMLTRFAIVTLLFASACATDDGGYEGWRPGGKDVGKALCPTGCTDGDVVRVLDEDGPFDQVGDGLYVAARSGETSQLEDVCTQLPDDGLCASACDAAAIESTLAPGACIHFACTLDDGRDLLVGRCAPRVTMTPALERR